MGNGLIEFYRDKVQKEWKISFYSALILGLLIHVYKFTNTLPNHDTLYNYYSNQNMIGSGRWLLSIACGISSYFDLPWVNGIISIIFIALSAGLVAQILKIDNPVLIVLTSGIFVASPCITETFFFEYTADGYMVAMFLATLAVWFSRIDHISKRNTAISIICVCCTCAIYQAYVSFALVLALIYFMLELLEGKLSVEQIKGGAKIRSASMLLDWRYIM